MNYQLLDFGRGRRLERFGEFILDRPCPAVERIAKAEPKLWDHANACFAEGGEREGRWFFPRKEISERWDIRFDKICFELKLAPTGQVGIFPEQEENWEWINRLTATRRGAREEIGEGNEREENEAKIKVLNLFAYTGGSTLAAAAAGMEVTHVDAAKNVIEWARRNAELSGLADAPIRWICEDAWKFVKREIKRGNRYDAVILDPPSYGHGPKNEVWQLAKHLPMLLTQCAELVAERCRFILLTCHTPGYEEERLSTMLKDCFPFAAAEGTIAAKPLALRTADNREMPSGAMVRWEKKL
jgi:23S rRNA (cytosine1962-C5)-methyltransferase